MIWLTAAGVLCFLYYFGIAVFSQQWNTTFSGFWAAAGLFFLAAGRAWPYLGATMQHICGMIFLLALLAVAAVEGRILHAMRKKVPEDLEWLIVLGAHVRGTKVTDTLRRRLDRAAEYAKLHDGVRIVVSGGQGNGEDISEALAMKRYLVGQGITEDAVLTEDTSTSTYENLWNSKALIKEYQTAAIGIVTNNFHIYRAVQIAKTIGYGNISGVPAGTKAIVFPNYMAREFFAEGKRLIELGRRKRRQK